MIRAMTLSEHPFSPASVRYEGGAPEVSERIWQRWINAAEALIGHSLDGNDVDADGDGYSLDEAFEWFESRRTPASYVSAVRARARYFGRPEGR